MRPITLTVLSEYGRDRISFQAYEHLFDPTLNINPYQSKINMFSVSIVYSLIDWLSIQISTRISYGWLWNILSKPIEVGKTNEIKLKKEILDCLNDLIRNNKETINSLSNHIKYSLCLSDDLIQSVLWDPPRSIMLEVIPTLLGGFIAIETCFSITRPYS